MLLNLTNCFGSRSLASYHTTHNPQHQMTKLLQLPLPAKQLGTHLQLYGLPVKLYRPNFEVDSDCGYVGLRVCVVSKSEQGKITSADRDTSAGVEGT